MIEMKEKRKFNFLTLALLGVIIVLGILIYLDVI
jgi:hypothetical protein